jgi:hypothetical protein
VRPPDAASEGHRGGIAPRVAAHRERPATPWDAILWDVERSFLQAYLSGFARIEGWFQYDAALMFMAYSQIMARCGVVGHTLEIGVHHGLSAIAIAALRGPDRLFYAIDLFEDSQGKNVSGSGGGNRTVFERNMREFYPDVRFMRVLAGLSSEIAPSGLGPGFSFCHIDGGHSREETYGDLRLCHSVLLPGGLVALDDYFNPEYPGVCEGAVEFALGNRGALQPVAIGFNKVLFQKTPAPGDLNSCFREALPAVDLKTVRLCDMPAVLFTSPLRFYLDLHASTPQRLVPLGAIPPRARFVCEEPAIAARAGQVVSLPVTVTNTSEEPFPAGDRVLGLSYHLLSPSGRVLQHDNDRTWLLTPMQPGESRTVELRVRTPSAPGQYRIEIDLVWEQVMWFKEVGNPTTLVDVAVR